jgi:hypothetical protein
MKPSRLSTTAAFGLAVIFATNATAGLITVADGYVIEAGNKYEVQGTVIGSCYTDNLSFAYKIGVAQVKKGAQLAHVEPAWSQHISYTCGNATVHHAECSDGTKWFFVNRILGDQFVLFCLGGEAIAISH